ncbi:MAG TPA: acyl-CoA dehydrogenase family protein [Candidatus Sulfotelmatobacter sp.]|nr:acyl-CoA dehydrogenase family protein [Candidatus Sulfotelmatobacter sp.]
MDFTMPEEIELLRRSVRDFVEKEAEPLAEQIDRDAQVPTSLMKQAAELGLFGLSIPAEYGGSGFGELGSVVALEELSRTNGAVGMVICPTAPAATIALAGTEAQKQKYLPPLAAGERLAGFCLTEPGAGSDAAGIKTSAVRKGDTFILNGNKLYTSRAAIAETFVVSAVTDPARKTKGGISVFLVEKGFPGFSVGSKDEEMGLRGSGSAEVVFEDCEVPADNVVGVVGGGPDVLRKILDRARLWAAARALGASRRILELSLDYACLREQFGKKIGAFQAIRLKLADMATWIHAGQFMVYQVAWKIDRGEDAVQEASMAKLFCSEMAGRIADMGVQIHGAMGFMKPTPVERFYRDVRAYRILDGTSDIQRLIIAGKLLRSRGLKVSVSE